MAHIPGYFYVVEPTEDLFDFSLPANTHLDFAFFVGNRIYFSYSSRASSGGTGDRTYKVIDASDLSASTATWNVGTWVFDQGVVTIDDALPSVPLDDAAWSVANQCAAVPPDGDKVYIVSNASPVDQTATVYIFSTSRWEAIGSPVPLKNRDVEENVNAVSMDDVLNVTIVGSYLLVSVLADDRSDCFIYRFQLPTGAESELIADSDDDRISMAMYMGAYDHNENAVFGMHRSTDGALMVLANDTDFEGGYSSHLSAVFKFDIEPSISYIGSSIMFTESGNIWAATIPSTPHIFIDASTMVFIWANFTNLTNVSDLGVLIDGLSGIPSPDNSILVASPQVIPYDNLNPSMVEFRAIDAFGLSVRNTHAKFELSDQADIDAGASIAEISSGPFFDEDDNPLNSEITAVVGADGIGRAWVMAPRTSGGGVTNTFIIQIKVTCPV